MEKMKLYVLAMNTRMNEEDDSGDDGGGGLSISGCELKARTWQANFSSTLHRVTLCTAMTLNIVLSHITRCTALQRNVHTTLSSTAGEKWREISFLLHIRA